MRWGPLISSQSVRVQLTTSTCDWHLKWGQTCAQSGTEPHAAGSDVSPRQVGDRYRSEGRTEVFQVEETQEGRAAFFPTQEGPARLPTPAADHASRLKKHGCPSLEQGGGKPRSPGSHPPLRGPRPLPGPGRTSHVVPVDPAVTVTTLQLQLHLRLHPRDHLLHAAELWMQEGRVSPEPSWGCDCSPASEHMGQEGPGPRAVTGPGLCRPERGV